MSLIMRAQQPQKAFARGQGARANTSVLRALIRFTRTEEAHRAVRDRQGTFLLNTSVSLRVLQ